MSNIVDRATRQVDHRDQPVRELFLKKPESLDAVRHFDDDPSIRELIAAELAAQNQRIEEKLERQQKQQEAYREKCKNSQTPAWYVDNFVPTTADNILDVCNLEKWLSDGTGAVGVKSIKIIIEDKGYQIDLPYKFCETTGKYVLQDEYVAQIKKELLVLKSVFHDAIYNRGKVELISAEYNTIFTDHYYDHLDFKSVDQLLSPSDQQKLIDAYHEKELQLVRRRNAKWRPPLFAKGEIVGAKDERDSWYLAEVLDVHTINGQAIYYVEYKGWGPQFNRFITSTWEIRKYNPRKHQYFRAAYHTGNARRLRKKENDDTTNDLIDSVNDTVDASDDSDAE